MTFIADGGDVPWPILRRFVELVESSGDIVRGPADSPSPITEPSQDRVHPPTGQESDAGRVYVLPVAQQW
ncbi:hypothetical protein [Micromonospora sp. NPDC049107]|uniref:hypothetical protein n=1 Tax=unclassified Micromonospora TaxID=2617518 RepID=UPI003411E6B8